MKSSQHAALMIGASLLLSTITSIARADIILFDMHVSNAEVKAARAAAKARGEKLIVIPKLAPQDRLDRDALLKTRKRLLDAVAKGKKSLAENELALARAENEMEIVDAYNLAHQGKLIRERLEIDRSDLQDVLARMPVSIDARKLLRETLAELEAQGREATSIIGSGESIGIGFEGYVGAVGRVDIRDVFDEFPALKSKLRSVYLWGCYSANRDDVVWWRESFPELQLVMGFWKKAPLESNPSSPLLLRDALIQEAVTLSLTSAKKLENHVKSLKRAGATSVAVAVDDLYIGTGFDPISLAAPPECAEAIHTLEAAHPAYQECFLAKGKCTSPPENTSSSRLRAFYSALQKYGHCRPYSTFIASLPSPSTVLPLIFYTRVRSHFARYFAAEIAEVNGLLRDSGFTMEFPDLLADPDDVTRRIVIDKIDYLKIATQAEDSPLKGDARVLRLLRAASTILKSLECMPTTWATEDDDVHRPVDPPHCGL